MKHNKVSSYSTFSAPGGAGGGSAGPRTPPPKGASGQQSVVKGTDLESVGAEGPQAPEPHVTGTDVSTRTDVTLPSIEARGGVNCRITPGPYTQLFGGARHPPSGQKPLPDPPPPPRGPLANGYGGWGVVGVQTRGVGPPVPLWFTPAPQLPD